MFGLLKSGLSRLQHALTKTRFILGDRLKKLFKGPLDEATLEELEEVLFEADLGAKVTCEAIEHVRKMARTHPQATAKDLLEEIKKFAKDLLAKPSHVQTSKAPAETPRVFLLVGVNGSGKTTTAAKLAHHFKKKKEKVLLAAGDTFRAAAIEQLDGWAHKLGIECVRGASRGDPAAVVFDALSAAKKRGITVVIADTAGRLQSKTHLMEELAKIKRTCHKVIPDAPHETFLVVDATTGQNALDQAKTFHSFAPLTGLIVSKLDGSAKGGIVLSIYRELGVPIRYIGIGEKVHDLIPFDLESYVDALFA